MTLWLKFQVIESLENLWFSTYTHFKTVKYDT